MEPTLRQKPAPRRISRTEHNLRALLALFGTAAAGMTAAGTAAAGNSCGSYIGDVGRAGDGDGARPNILWVTFEDTSAGEFGCYGNPYVKTPNADSLAANGIRFMNAWSCGPQSSPARSSIITGCYATTYGMDHHPVSYDTPPDIFFPQRLREAGYYCTNNNKTHYNSTTSNKICWDECDKKASYNSPRRAAGQPFFAVFNCVASHMGRIRTFHTEGRRDYSEEGIFIDSLALPSYVPDLPEVRSDYAGHLEAVQDIDTWLGFFLKDLREKGLADDTIVFFFSDHGGCIPRGKGYLYESGLDVPFIVYFPEKWKHLADRKPGDDDRLIGFVDLAPTVLSLAGVRPPENMQGKALFGKYTDRGERNYQFAFSANHLHHFTPARAVSDGRFKLLRTYIPYRQFAMRNYYQWGMPSNKAWDRCIIDGTNENPAYALPFSPHPAEMLFDLVNDPGEINDLSGNPEYAEKLDELRSALDRHIRSTGDLGFFLPTSREGHILYDKVRKENYPLDELYDLVAKAGVATAEDVPYLTKYLSDERDEMRFWAVVGFARLARGGILKNAPEALGRLMDDKNPYVAAEAAFAMAYSGKPRAAIARLVSVPQGAEDRKIFLSSLECLSLDSSQRKNILKYAGGQLKAEAGTLPRKANEDAGLMVRGILVNLGELDIDLLHGPEAYEEGLRLNRGRRKMLPLP